MRQRNKNRRISFDQKIPVIIVSGFLGAGKSTLINYFLEERLTEGKTVLIENDFGSFNLDAAQFEHQGFTVEALTQGCICCSLTGEFVTSLTRVVERYQPMLILVEPSGMGKLTEVVAAVERAAATLHLDLIGCVTTVDVRNYALYYNNFGEFFDDQVRTADYLYGSHSDLGPFDEEGVYNLLRILNDEAPFTTEKDEVTAALRERLALSNDDRNEKPCHYCEQHHRGSYHGSHHDESSAHYCEIQHDESGHHHGDNGHHHAGDIAVETATLTIDRPLSEDEVKSLFRHIFRSPDLNVLRAKGLSL